MSDIDLDLDLLAPQPRKITFGGETITVKPPRAGKIMVLVLLLDKLQEVKDKDDQIYPVMDKLQAEVVDSIPELGGKSLTNAQLLALVNMIIELASVPKKDGEELVIPESGKPAEGQEQEPPKE